MDESEGQAQPDRTLMSHTNDRWTEETITWVQAWAPNLFSFRITRPKSFRFVAGQWARLGVRRMRTTPDTESDPWIWRAYSIVSASYDDTLEFYSIVVPEGEFTSELSHLKAGDALRIEKQAYGFLTLDRFVGGKDLWLLSTGTGIAPFLSVLFEPSVWETFENIVLVHSVRHPHELTYQQMIGSYQHHPLLETNAKFEGKLRLIFQAIVTRDPLAALHQRLPELITSGKLEQTTGIDFDDERSRFMLCGNPEMIDDTRAALASRGFRPARKANPGHVAVENYW